MFCAVGWDGDAGCSCDGDGSVNGDSDGVGKRNTGGEFAVGKSNT